MNAFFALLAGLQFAALFAQTNSGTIIGSVRDAHDAVVTTANITVTNIATGVAKTLPVNSAGEFAVPYLVPGQYTVSAESAGFKRTTREGITLRVSDQLVINLRLEVGAIAETVTVNATTPNLETASVTLGQVIDTRQILDLPLNGRDAMALASLTPGVRQRK